MRMLLNQRKITKDDVERALRHEKEAPQIEQSLEELEEVEAEAEKQLNARKRQAIDEGMKTMAKKRIRAVHVRTAMVETYMEMNDLSIRSEDLLEGTARSTLTLSQKVAAIGRSQGLEDSGEVLRFPGQYHGTNAKRKLFGDDSDGSVISHDDEIPPTEVKQEHVCLHVLTTSPQRSQLTSCEGPEGAGGWLRYANANT